MVAAMLTSDSGAALSDWASAVGEENVITDSGELRAAERGTFSVGHRIPAIVRPGSRAEVQECLRIANRRRCPVYPISGGRNWGYGSRVPAADGCVLLDLRRCPVYPISGGRNWGYGSRVPAADG